MLLAALIDAGAAIKVIQSALDNIPLNYPKCKTLQLQVRETNTHGFRARAVELRIKEDTEETQAREFLRAAENIAKASKISSKAASFAIGSLEELVTAESKLHDVSADKVHLHEAGSADTLGDVFGVAAACDALGVFDSEIYSTPVAVGGGIISFSHGTMAAPAPAVLEIARRRGIPILGGPEGVELTTPTGMSMLAHLARDFVENYPPLIPEVVGLGAGTKELTAGPNLVRVVMGRSVGIDQGADSVVILETNLDDLPGELLGHALQQILDLGAKDAWISQAQFKKNRPGQVLHVICNSTDSEKLANTIMEETGTLGVRYHQWNRFTALREMKTLKVKIEGREFDVRVKFAKQRSGKITNVKPEFDDIHIIAKELSMPARKVSELVLRQAQKMAEE
jgi:uncharacterized protein (TIGR00299 family) protein